MVVNSDLATAWLGRGHVYYDLKRFDDALAAYDKALSQKSDLAEAWYGRGSACVDLKRHDEALVDFARANALKPNSPGVEGARLARMMSSVRLEKL